MGRAKRLKTLLFVAAATAVAAPAMSAQECGESILETLRQSRQALNTSPEENRILAVRNASAARNSCSDDADALGLASVVYNQAASAFSASSDMFTVYGTAFDTVLESEAVFDPEAGDAADIYQLANGALKNIASYLLLFADAGMVHPIFETETLAACPYTVDEQRRVRFELTGYTETVASFSLKPEAISIADQRFSALQSACSIQERWILEARAELHLNYATVLTSTDDPAAAQTYLQAARGLLDASFELSGVGKPYSTVEDMHLRIDQGLAGAEVRAD